MSRSGTNRLPWVVVQTSGISEMGTFCGLLNVSPPLLIHEGIVWSVDQRFNAYIVVTNENFIVSSRTEFSFCSNQSFVY